MTAALEIEISMKKSVKKEIFGYLKIIVAGVIIAILLTLSGIVLLFSGFWIDPQGLIDNSVLVAFGEISTFAGALFGVDYTYKFKINDNGK